MSDNQSNLTDKEMEDLQSIVADTLASVCVMADKHNIDRDSMLKYLADMLTTFAEVATIQNYETNHTCNCKHNRSSRDNEPCCRCDSKHTNADRIRNMSDEELAEFMSENTSYYYCGVRCKDRPKSPTESSCFMWLEWLQSEAE